MHHSSLLVDRLVCNCGYIVNTTNNTMYSIYTIHYPYQMYLTSSFSYQWKEWTMSNVCIVNKSDPISGTQDSWLCRLSIDGRFIAFQGHSSTNFPCFEVSNVFIEFNSNRVLGPYIFATILVTVWEYYRNPDIDTSLTFIRSLTREYEL